MREIITEKHREKGTATTSINKKGKSIDGMRDTEGIHISAGDYIMFNKGPCYNNRLIWVSISQSNAFGKMKTPIRPQGARKNYNETS